MSKKTMEYFEKNEFIKERWGSLTFKPRRGPGVPRLNFEGDPGVPLLNFRGVPCPTFKLWGGSQALGPRVLRSQVPR